MDNRASPRVWTFFQLAHPVRRPPLPLFAQIESKKPKAGQPLEPARISSCPCVLFFCTMVCSLAQKGSAWLFFFLCHVHCCCSSFVLRVRAVLCGAMRFVQQKELPLWSFLVGVAYADEAARSSVSPSHAFLCGNVAKRALLSAYADDSFFEILYNTPTPALTIPLLFPSSLVSPSPSPFFQLSLHHKNDDHSQTRAPRLDSTPTHPRTRPRMGSTHHARSLHDHR